MRRALGLDVGSKTIGVAVSDSLGITAQGVCTIRRHGWDNDLAALMGYVREYEAAEFVVGLPKNMDGSIGPAADKAAEFAERLRGDSGLPVTLVDERLSTMIATKTLIGGGVSRENRKGVVDKLAAQIILQGYLDRKQRETK